LGRVIIETRLQRGWERPEGEDKERHLGGVLVKQVLVAFKLKKGNLPFLLCEKRRTRDI